MLRDEIAEQLEAAKRRDDLLTALLVLCLVAAAGFVVYRTVVGRATRKDRDAEKLIVFAGRSVRPPALWKLNPQATTPLKLAVLPDDGGAKDRIITIDDQRAHPEQPEQLEADVRETLPPGAAIAKVESYHDASSDATGATCVWVDPGKLAARMRIVCLSADGRFKVTLNGRERDIRPFDTMVEQLSVYEN